MSDSFLDLSSVETTPLLEAWRWLVPESMSIQSITPFGDAFLLDTNDTVHWLNTDSGKLTLVAISISEFKQALANPSNLEQWFVPSLLESIRQHLPVLRSGQCYSPILPPCVGGTYQVSNFEVSSLAMHFGILGQMHEKNRSLDDDTPTKKSEFIQAAMEGLKAQTSAHSSTWHLGEEKNWAADLETGLVIFTFADGTMASAPIQVVGTYNTTDGTFLWAWEHPSVPEPLRKHALLAKQWGETNHVPNFTTSKVNCSESEAWTFAAVANRVANANGVYRGPAGTALVFMTLGEIKLEKKKP